MDQPKQKGKRIYEVAKEYHISSEALVSMLKGMGAEVKSHMSVVGEDMLARINRKFEEERESSRQEIQRKKARAEERKHEVGAPVPQAETGERKKGVKRPPKRAPSRGGADGTFARKVPRGRVSQEPLPVKPQTRRVRRTRRKAPDQRVVEETVRRTMAEMQGVVRPKHRRVKHQAPGEAVGEENIIRLSEFSSVAELAEHLQLAPTDVIAKCLEMGLLVSINQRLDMDTMMMVADEFGYQIEPLAEYGEDLIQEEDTDGQRSARAPVVTIMGHVDHGKTSLLDYVRKSKIVAGESGGITQHIGAYEVVLEGGSVTFLDTPGHEAFTAMRARGAQVTDIVVLVVAADDSVMPQTVEAIDHARAAGVPIVVAINKMDLPTADPERIKRQLSERGLLVEEWGGKTTCALVSAKSGEGVAKFLELLLLEAEMLELSANRNKRARGTIIEARLSQGRGPMATVLVQEGTLRPGAPFVTGVWAGKVRALLDERDHLVESAGPSTPVQVVGIEGVPQAGDSFLVVAEEREAREISQKRQQLRREQEYRKVRKIALADVYSRIKEGEMRELRLVVKGDVDGSVGALSDSLMQLSNDEVTVVVIHSGVGAISESDVLLASASDAIIVGFHVRPDARAVEMAEREHVDVRFYRVIYKAVEDVKAALSGLLSPEITERTLGMAEVRDIFKVPRVGTVAGCFVQSGLVRRNASVRLVRDDVVVHEGIISSLRRFKEDAREVAAGFECGIGLQDFDDIRAQDVLEVYETVETARTL